MRRDNVKKKSILKIVVIVLVFVFLAVNFWYSNLSPTSSAEDITITANLRQNDTGIVDYKDLVVYINLDKKSKQHGIFYPVIKGVQMPTYSDEDDAGYFMFSSMGYDETTKAEVYRRLKEEGLDVYLDDQQLMGFWVDDDAGTYNSRIFYETTEDFDTSNLAGIVYVYIEERYGKTFLWSTYEEIQVNGL